MLEYSSLTDELLARVIPFAAAPSSAGFAAKFPD